MAVTMRERKKQQTILDITAAALALFETQGYEATTVDDIARRADFSQSTFFRHFSSKEAVVFLDLPERLAGLLFEVRPGEDLWAAVRRGISEQVQALAGAPEPQRRCISLWFTEPALQRRFREFLAVAERNLTSFLAEHLTSDGRSDVECEVIAQAVIGVGISAAHRQEQGPDAVAAALEAGFDVLERGLGAYGSVSISSARADSNTEV